LCSCGERKKISTSNLTSGSTVSCGHLLKEKRHTFRLLPDNSAEKNYLYLAYLHGAKNRGLKFSLTKDVFFEIIKQDCFYCGEAPSNERKSRSKNKKPFLYNGVDRIDNKIGYEDKNVVPCCMKCNFMKKDMQLVDFLKQVERIADHVKKRL